MLAGIFRRVNRRNDSIFCQPSIVKQGYVVNYYHPTGRNMNMKLCIDDAPCKV